jgi:hypothetical protein
MERRSMGDLDPSNLFEVVVRFDCVDFFNPHDSPVCLINGRLNPWDRPVVQKIEQTVKVVGGPVRQDKDERSVDSRLQSSGPRQRNTHQQGLNSWRELYFLELIERFAHRDKAWYGQRVNCNIL